MKRILSTMFLGFLFWACSDSSSGTAGATSETTNGIAFTVVDASQKPVAHARITLYSSIDISVQGTAETDSLGKAYFDTLATDVFVEGIAGEDSSLMSWSALDTNQTEIQLLPSASLTVRTGAAEADYAKLIETLALGSTPYTAVRNGSDYVFSHVPAGAFNVVAGDSLIASVSLEKGDVADTLFRIPDVTREFIFEDYDDGDSLNNLAKVEPNYGWYLGFSDSAHWVRPDSNMRFTDAIIDNNSQGKYLSLAFTKYDSSYILLGTHLGLDTGYYDLSSLTAIRLKVRGDCEFSVALEHYREVGDNTYRKSLWNTQATQEWTEIVLRPGQEILNEENLHVPWTEISKEIGMFTIFIVQGTFLEIDEIVFEGIDSATLENTTSRP